MSSKINPRHTPGALVAAQGYAVELIGCKTDCELAHYYLMSVADVDAALRTQGVDLAS